MPLKATDSDDSLPHPSSLYFHYKTDKPGSVTNTKDSNVIQGSIFSAVTLVAACVVEFFVTSADLNLVFQASWETAYNKVLETILLSEYKPTLPGRAGLKVSL